MFALRLPWASPLPLLLAGCAASGQPARVIPLGAGEGSLPAVPTVDGPLRLSVVYPATTDIIDARDSTFLFGSVGSGGASVTVEGQPARVWPNGAWLAWVAIPPDSLINFSIVARTADDSASLIYPVRRVRRFQPPLAPVWIDSASASPAARAWWPRDEFLPLSVRAAEGASVRLILPGGSVVPLAPDVGPDEVPAAIRAFDRDTGNLAGVKRADRYTGVLRGRPLGADPGPPPTAPIIIEAVIGTDTARARWPLQLALLDSVPQVVEFNDDTAGKGDTDSLTVGRARPGATYHWFFPTGTRATVSGRLGDDLRVRLSRGQEAWVPAADAVSLPPGTAAVRGTVASLTVTPAADRLVIRIPVTQRVPFRVEERDGELTLRLYNAVADINWTRYGTGDPYLREIRWLQAASDEVTITATLRGPVWGYRTRWTRNDLLLEIRRPPAIDPRHPLAGRLIVLDPGHPPLGATGPTGLREADANLGIALQLRDLLAAGGARVVLTRATDQSLELWASSPVGGFPRGRPPRLGSQQRAARRGESVHQQRGQRVLQSPPQPRAGAGSATGPGATTRRPGPGRRTRRSRPGPPHLDAGGSDGGALHDAPGSRGGVAKSPGTAGLCPGCPRWHRSIPETCGGRAGERRPLAREPPASRDHMPARSLLLPLGTSLLLATASFASAQSPAEREVIRQFRDSLAQANDSDALLALEQRLIALAKSDRQNAILHLRLGFVALRLGDLGSRTRYDDGASEFEWATELEPTWPWAWYGLGLAEDRVGDSEVSIVQGLQAMFGKDHLSRAANAYARSVQADPSFVQGLVDLAATALRQRVNIKTMLAREALRQAAATTAAANPEVLLYRGRVEREVGDVDSALAAFEGYLARGGNPGLGQLELARTQFLRGWLAGQTGLLRRRRE